MSLSRERIQDYIPPLNNCFCYFPKVGFHKTIFFWRNGYFGCVCFGGLEVPSLSVVTHHRAGEPSAMLGSLLPPCYERGIAGKGGVGCYSHKRRGLEPPALSDVGITPLTTSFVAWLRPQRLRVRARTCL